MKVILFIGAKQMKCKKTRVVKCNLTNPIYKESFTFSLPPEGLDQTCICIQVMQQKSKLSFQINCHTKITLAYRSVNSSRFRRRANWTSRSGWKHASKRQTVATLATNGP